MKLYYIKYDINKDVHSYHEADNNCKSWLYTEQQAIVFCKTRNNKRKK